MASNEDELCLEEINPPAPSSETTDGSKTLHEESIDRSTTDRPSVKLEYYPEGAKGKLRQNKNIFSYAEPPSSPDRLHMDNEFQDVSWTPKQSKEIAESSKASSKKPANPRKRRGEKAQVTKTYPKRRQNSEKAGKKSAEKASEECSPTDSLDSIIETLRKRDEGLQQTLEESVAEQKRTAEDHSKALKTINEQNLMLGSLEKEVASLKHTETKQLNKINELKQEKKSLQSEYLKLRNDMPVEYDEFKVSDDYVLGLWKRLAYNIRNLVSTHVTRLPAKDRTVSNDTQFEKLKDACTAYPAFANGHLRSYIWLFICTEVFYNENGVWSGELGKNFVTFCHNTQASQDIECLKMISKIKFTTAQDIERAFGFQMRPLSSMVETVTNMLYKFTANTDRKRLCSEVRSILELSSTLQLIFLKSKAIFVVVTDAKEIKTSLYNTASYGNSDSGRDVSVDEPGLPRRRELVTAPWLLKKGNADGENFDRFIFLCQGEIEVYDES